MVQACGIPAACHADLNPTTTTWQPYALVCGADELFLTLDRLIELVHSNTTTNNMSVQPTYVLLLLLLLVMLLLLLAPVLQLAYLAAQTGLHDVRQTSPAIVLPFLPKAALLIAAPTFASRW